MPTRMRPSTTPISDPKKACRKISIFLEKAKKAPRTTLRKSQPSFCQTFQQLGCCRRSTHEAFQCFRIDFNQCLRYPQRY